MRKDQIQSQHIALLKEKLNTSFAEVEVMSYDELDKLSDDLMMLECDALEEDSDELDIICEIEDIIFDEVEPDSMNI